MINSCVVEKVDGEWRITSGFPIAGRISQESFSSEEEGLKALKEGNYSF
ncbi:hypothetical protein [Sporosarcina sp. E16_8]|nr:hypothetical protein [Sporosarcina sp. E16_8]MBO0585689.1 hypothetical protein [Sporosarcina sp. E16_8]